MKSHPCEDIVWKSYDEGATNPDGEWVLVVESEYERTIDYCPYCGEKLE